jgi:hypothetical protein
LNPKRTDSLKVAAKSQRIAHSTSLMLAGLPIVLSDAFPGEA